ncbi:uncharacterized protein LOC143430641 [Xylocopa sonorina]|uniref:uncharacterized protein LOC143430641 n=1 Tax=Xylocopa sonorina TaxID=1818115 RepID=UPI00403A994E
MVLVHEREKITCVATKRDKERQETVTGDSETLAAVLSPRSTWNWSPPGHLHWLFAIVALELNRWQLLRPVTKVGSEHLRICTVPLVGLGSLFFGFRPCWIDWFWYCA